MLSDAPAVGSPAIRSSSWLMPCATRRVGLRPFLHERRFTVFAVRRLEGRLARFDLPLDLHERRGRGFVEMTYQRQSLLQEIENLHRVSRLQKKGCTDPSIDASQP